MGIIFSLIPVLKAHGLGIVPLVLQFMAETLPPKPTFTVKDIPDLSGKVVIVTGANTGSLLETETMLRSS